MVKRGRPRKVPAIPVDKIGELAGYGCTVEEIATLCELSRDTLERNFAAEIAKGRENCKKKLRMKQLEVAMKGNPAMLIWLGKQMLEQRDKAEFIETFDPLLELIAEMKAEHLRVVVPAEVN